MPIDLEKIVERELDRRLKKAVFHAWKGEAILRHRVEIRWFYWMQHHGYLLRWVLRYWAANKS